MRPVLTRSTLAGLALAALLGSGLAQAASSPFQLTGSTDSGPLAGISFSGSFAYDAGAVLPGFSGSVLLQRFALQFAGQTYDLAGADAPPAAVFEGGQFIGLDFTDADSADAGLRPHLALVPSLTGLAADAYLAYAGADGLAGFGSYSVSAVPEPASLALLLGGLALVGAASRPQALTGRATGATNAAAAGCWRLSWTPMTWALCCPPFSPPRRCQA